MLGTPLEIEHPGHFVVVINHRAFMLGKRYFLSGVQGRGILMLSDVLYPIFGLIARPFSTLHWAGAEFNSVPVYDKIEAVSGEHRTSSRSVKNN